MTLAELSPAQRALLLCWSPKESVFADHPDYPCDLNDEHRVMKELAALGLFCVEDYDDEDDGPCRRMFVTSAGRELVAARSATASQMEPK